MSDNDKRAMRARDYRGFQKSLVEEDERKKFEELKKQQGSPDRTTTVAISGNVAVQLKTAAAQTGIPGRKILETAVVEYLKKIG